MEIIRYIQSFSNPFLDKLFTGITMFGEEYISILILVTVYWCLNKQFGYRLGFAIILSFVFNGVIKDTFKVARPIGQTGIHTLREHTATGYSFPSGHTQNTTVLWTALMVEVKKRWLYFLSSFIILAVAFSRLYLGVHWPKDVIGGIIFGIISLFIASYIFTYIQRTKEKRLLSIIIVLSLVGTMFFKSSDYSKAVGMVIGFILGYIIEDTYIKYDVKAIIWKQIVKVILGLAVLIGIKVVLKEILPLSTISDMIRYAMIGFWCIAGAPYLFKRIRLS